MQPPLTHSRGSHSFGFGWLVSHWLGSHWLGSHWLGSHWLGSHWLGSRWRIACCVVCVLWAGTRALGNPPNILFIYIDDLGWKDPSYMGSDFFETPHLDRLAHDGMIFTDAYSCAANCAPSRACVMSGQTTPRHQIYNVGTRARGESVHRRLKPIPGTNTLAPTIRTWAHQLQSVGYATAAIGKWHLSKDPTDFGFEFNVGGTHSGSAPRGHYPPHGRVPGLDDAPDDEYLTDRLSEEAIGFIGRHQDTPWAIYLSHFAVHTPLNAKRELVAKYRAKPAGQLHDHVTMATMIQAVDDGVGRIMDQLKAWGLARNTVVLFSSDNGGYGPATDMAPLKGYKGTYYEGGIRVPFFVNWPQVVSPAGRSAVPISGIDLYPTICEIAGVDCPETQPIDGVSLVPLLTGKTKDRKDRALYWHFPAYLESYQVFDEQRDPLFRSRPCSIIRYGRWKLHQYFEDGGLELYDLDSDIGETRNLADELPDRSRELLAKLESWRQRVKAPIPTEPNPTYDAAAEAEAIAKQLEPVHQ